MLDRRVSSLIASDSSRTLLEHTHLSTCSFSPYEIMRLFTALSLIAIFAPAAMALQPGDIPVEIAVRSDA
jgi:hypothetical protein